MKILIVEDDPGVLKVAVAFLAEIDAEILQAESAEEAEKILGLEGTSPSEKIDLVLTDLILPGINGIELCSRIKKDKKLKDTQVIMMTQYDDMDHMKNAYAVGIMDFIAKPLRKEELLTRITSAMSVMQSDPIAINE